MKKADPKSASSPSQSPLSQFYQGMIFFSPFFFLLLDSFLESSFPSALCAVSVLLASVVPGVLESAFAGCSLEAPASLPLASLPAVVEPATPDSPGAAGGAPAPGGVAGPGAGVAESLAGAA